MNKLELIQWLEKYFQYLRNSKEWHLGLGDIRLSIGQQDQIVEMIKEMKDA
jgi:hypothetical protein